MQEEFNFVFSNPDGKSVGMVVQKMFWKKQTSSGGSTPVIYVSLRARVLAWGAHTDTCKRDVMNYLNS